MRSFLTQLFFSFVVFFASLLGTLFWLSIPLILQVIIDKVIVQNSPESLNTLGGFLLLLTLIASVFEIGIASLTAVLLQGRLASNKFLQLASELPKVLVFFVIMMYYSPQIAVTSIIMTTIACVFYYFLKKSRIRAEQISEPLPLSFRLPLTIIVLFVLWHATFMVLDGEITLGQWLAIGIFNLQFVASALSLTAAAIVRRKSSSGSSEIAP
jgi:ABC-type bacteriocin/lantibiotic exporter with double-glycine peptidase domain